MSFQVLLALLALYLCLIYRDRRDTNSCPQCGTRDPDRHSKDCSWRG